MDGWNNIGAYAASAFDVDDMGRPFVITGCDRLAFDPTIDVVGSSTKADAPTGLDVDLRVPQSDSQTALATAHVKDVTVRLPQGISVSPSSANGLAACSDAQVGLGNTDPEQCPNASKLGTAEVASPLLDEPMAGNLYLGTQESDDPMSGKMFRLFLVASGSGVTVKLEGGVTADPATGQVTATFKNSPQLPFSDLKVKLFGGPTGPLATPAACGDSAVTADVSSWSGKAVSQSTPLAVGCRAGLGGFAPSFSAGMANPSAGATSTFTLQAHKPDGQSDLNGITLSMPTGLLAHLKGNIGQRIGTARVAAGSGSSPFWLSGPVVLEGPYGDAPFSLRVTVPVIAGPFNLGDVVVRQKVYVDPVDAHVTVVSDPLPTIVKGIPVRLQNLAVDIDKAGFMVNPTGCSTRAVKGTLGAVTGQAEAVSSRFQVGGCADLDLAPKLDLALSGKGQTTDDKHPALTATLTQPAGQANLKQVKVALPLSLALDPDNSQSDDLCEFTVGQHTIPDCPKSSIVGTATAVTPLLDQPLSGPVYFVKNVRTDKKTGRQIKTLPTLAIPLRGEGVTLVLRASSEVVHDRLVTTFDNIPDAPVSDFKLNINGGKKGILVVSGANLCKSTQVADQAIDGQNGKLLDHTITMSTPCKVGVEGASHTSTRLRVMVGGIGAGEVTISGKGLQKTRRKIHQATTATLAVRLTKAVRHRIAQHRNTKIKVKVRFNPTAAGEKTTTIQKHLTIHAAKKK